MAVFQRSQTRSSTIDSTQKTHIAKRKKGRSISLLVRIIEMVKKMQVTACTCRTIEKDSKQPLLSLAQLTLYQLVMQFITKPQNMPTSKGKYIDSLCMRQLTNVKAEVAMTASMPALPTLITGNLSLMKALTIAPMMQPTPSVIKRYPTLRLDRILMKISLLKYTLMKPLIMPSRMTGMKMQYILGQYRMVLRKMAFICWLKGVFMTQEAATAVVGPCSLNKESLVYFSSKLSRQNVQTRQEAIPSTDKIMKQIWLPNKPSPKVVMMAPNKLLPQTMPFVTPKYFPSSFFGILQILNSFMRYPPWLTQQIAAPYPPKKAPMMPITSPRSPLNPGMQTRQLTVCVMAETWNCHLNLVMAGEKMSVIMYVRQLTARATSGPQLYCPSSCSAMQVMMHEKLRKVVQVSMKYTPRAILCLSTYL